MAARSGELDALKAENERLAARLAQLENRGVEHAAGSVPLREGHSFGLQPGLRKDHRRAPGSLYVGMSSREVTQAMIDAGRYPGMSLEEVEEFLQTRFLNGLTDDVRLIRGKVTYSATCKVIGPGAWLASFQDITQHIAESERVSEELRDSEERFRLAAEAAGFGIWDYDMGSDERSWSDQLRMIFGLAPDAEQTLETALETVHPEDREFFHHKLIEIRDTAIGRFEATFRIKRPSDQAERWVTFNGWKTVKAESAARRIIMTVRDVTDEKLAQHRIEWTALHDSLTGLGNRAFFQNKLEEAIAQAGDCNCVGLLMLDIDHFKQINDSLGHDAGDELLKMFAQRLRSITRSGDSIARLGGDEFAIILNDVNCQQDITNLTDSILQRMREPFVHQGQILDCRASIGAALCPSHGRSPTELMKHADIALYASKAAGRATSTLFRTSMKADALKRESMIQLARSALRDERVVPFYQPKTDLRTGRVLGFEALLRWRTRRGRIRTPASISAAFADLEVANALSDCMVNQVIADLRRWLDDGVDFGHVAVNASAADFHSDDFAERLLEKLAKAGVPTKHFELEVTETVFLGRGAENVQRALKLLNMEGVTIALDDFGTGYASLRHLKQFPVDTIKIDCSFTRDMLDDAGDEAIIRAVINLGRSLAIKVVAEGIERVEQAQHLVRLGCDVGQGFLFSRAAPAGKVPGLVSQSTLYPEVEDQANIANLRLVG